MNLHKKFFLFLSILFAGTMLRAEITVSNAGIPGNSSGEALARIERDVLSEKPYAVIVLLGANDALNPRTITAPEKFEQNIFTIGQKLLQNNVKKVIFVTTFPVVESILRRRAPIANKLVPLPNTLEDHFRKYGNAVRSAAKKLDATVIDSFELFAANGGATEAKSSLFRTYANSKAHDGSHLTANGYAKFAEFLVARIKNDLPKDCHIVCLGDSITYGVHVKGAGSVEGETYPAQLWKLLNPELAASGKKPTSKKISSNGNLFFNSSLELLNEKGFPKYWIFWQKDQDSVQLLKEDNSSFFRVIRSSKTSARLRPEIIRITPGKYRWSLQMRGKGIAEVSISLYHPVRHQDVKRTKLTSEWQTYSGEITVPRKVSRLGLTVKVYAQADIKNVSLEKIEDSNQTESAKMKFVPATKISSPELKMSFSSPESGAAITGIQNRSGKQFVNFQPAKGIWSIRLKQIKIDRSKIPPITGIACDPEMDDSADSIGKDGESSNDIIIDAYMAKQLGAQCSVEKLPGKLVFNWKNIRVGKEKNALDVSVSVSKATTGGMIFSGNFVNRSKEHTVFYFNYPQISGMGKINGNGEDDFLATPHYLGRLIKNPSSGKLFKNARIFRGNNSGHSMHFDAFYSKDGDGLFFGVWDSDQNIKRWDLTSSSVNGFGWNSIHLPDNMKCPPPQKWTIPYPIEVRSFTGDWYDAAQIYRKWAILQEWCSEGTLTQRRGKDIPAWFLDVTVWHHISVVDILRRRKKEFDGVLASFKEHKNAIWLTHWGVDNKRYDFPTPDRFPLTEDDKKVLSQLQKAGYPISGYIQFTAWTKTMPSFSKYPEAENNLLRNYYGQILSWGGTGYRKDSMFVYPGELWQKVLSGFVEEMVRSGFVVAYLDSGNHGGHHLNFTPSCTKRSGGGNDYVKNGQKMLKLVRKKGRAINPDFCTTTESFWEGNLHCLDAVLCVNSPSAYLEGDRVTAIPLAPTVYNDYAVLFATHYGIADVGGNAEGLIAKTAQALVWGIMPGWELPHAMYRFSDPERVFRTSKLRMEAWDAGRKFLQYGKMLRPPVIKGDNPELIIPWGIGWRKAVYDVKTPAAIGTAYAANDGSLGVILYNQDKVPHHVTVALDDPEYVGTKSKIEAVYPKGFKVKNNSGNLELTLPAQTPVILQLQ